MTGDSASRPTPLALRLADRIGRIGPIPVADYVEACLQDPEHGYYRRQIAIGAEGDFVTAPEISQVFGELIGLWCAVVWQQMGSPASLRLLELGPGRGTLMRDALRAVRLVPAFRDALRVEFVETNTALIDVQRATLADAGVPVAWHDDLKGDAAPTIVIANEFLDTLPVEQLIFHDGAWRERLVGLNAAGDLTFLDGSRAADAGLPPGLPSPSEGDVLETRRRAFDALARTLAKLGEPMAGLFIDYGHAKPGYGDTLQAVARHRYAGPFEAPGEADLTAQVDFAAFADALHEHGIACDGPVPQGEFLGRLGAVERASRLMAANPAQAGDIEAAVARLMAPTGMGGRFQVLGIRSVDLGLLPALTPMENGRHAT